MDSLHSKLRAFLDRNVDARVSDAIKLREVWERTVGERIASYTGNVIYDKKDPNIIVVYTGSSFLMAELQAEKELYRLMMSEALARQADSPLKEVRFVVSRNAAKEQKAAIQQNGSSQVLVTPVALTEIEDRDARESLSTIDNEELKKSLYKAMKTNLEWKKGIEVSKTSQSLF